MDFEIAEVPPPALGEPSFKDNIELFDLIYGRSLKTEFGEFKGVSHSVKSFKDFGKRLDALINLMPIAEIGFTWEIGIYPFVKEINGEKRFNLYFIPTQVKPGYNPDIHQAKDFFLDYRNNIAKYPIGVNYVFDLGTMWP